MTEQFKLNFADANDRGFLRANFKDRDGEDCSIQESSIATENCIWLGQNQGTHHHVTGDCLARMHLNREMAKALGFALIRFARNGSLVEPSPIEQLASIAAAFDEAEEWDKLSGEVTRLAREFVSQKSELLQAHNDGYDPTSPYCHELQGHIQEAESALDKAVETLEAWMQEHEWKESKEKR